MFVLAGTLNWRAPNIIVSTSIPTKNKLIIGPKVTKIKIWQFSKKIYLSKLRRWLSAAVLKAPTMPSGSWVEALNKMARVQRKRATACRPSFKITPLIPPCKFPSFFLHTYKINLFYLRKLWRECQRSRRRRWRSRRAPATRPAWRYRVSGWSPPASARSAQRTGKRSCDARNHCGTSTPSTVHNKYIWVIHPHGIRRFYFSVRW